MPAFPEGRHPHRGVLCPQGEKGEPGEKGDPGVEVGCTCPTFCVIGVGGVVDRGLITPQPLQGSCALERNPQLPDTGTEEEAEHSLNIEARPQSPGSRSPPWCSQSTRHASFPVLESGGRKRNRAVSMQPTVPAASIQWLAAQGVR